MCLISGTHRWINGVILQPGGPQPVYRAGRFEMTLGNGSLLMRVNGQTFTVPQVNNAIGYAIGVHGRHVLPASKNPLCQ